MSIARPDQSLIDRLLDRWEEECNSGREPDLQRLCKDHPEVLLLLLDGYSGLKAGENANPTQSASRIPEAIDRLIRYYDEIGKPDQAEHWRNERTQQAVP